MVANSNDPNADTIEVLIKWLYPRMDGKAQGRFCFYCPKTVDLTEPDHSMASWMRVLENPATPLSEKKKFFAHRNTLIEFLSTKAGGGISRREWEEQMESVSMTEE